MKKNVKSHSIETLRVRFAGAKTDKGRPSTAHGFAVV